MPSRKIKHVKSKYKHVRGIERQGNIHWCVTMKGISSERFKTEYEAAKAVDVLLIKKGKEPINVLKRAI